MSSEAPEGYTARPVTRDDVASCTALAERYDRGLGLEPYPMRSFLEWIVQLSWIDLGRDTVVVEGHAAAAAFGFAMRDPASEASDMLWFGMVDPTDQGRGLGSWLIGWAHGLIEERRAEEGAFIVRSEFPAQDARAHELFARAGYGHVRTNWDMARPIDDPLDRPAAPEGVAIRSFEEGRDERTWWSVAEAAFSDHFGFAPAPYASWANEWYEQDEWDPSRVLLAEADGEVVGELGWVQNGTDGYIGSLGVLAGHRRRGIGSTLLRHAFTDIAAAGFTRATLTVDTGNTTGAVGLYRSVGMEPIREGHVFERGAA
ncbi:MAG TPA: GNAT family N-acetyltransferase [Actinomycetota bacterium]|nr:GNAT family N-acetyltransferase [Actinomycetota bacterium]